MSKSDKIFSHIIYLLSFIGGAILIWKNSNSGTMWGVLLIALAVSTAVYIRENK